MVNQLLILSVLSGLLIGIECSSDFKPIVSSSTESTLLEEYNSLRSDAITSPIIDFNKSNARLDYDYETQQQVRPVDDSNNIYNRQQNYDYVEPIKNRFTATEYGDQYSQIADQNHNFYSPTHTSTQVHENPYDKQPVYANLYWRKIIYPHQSYMGEYNKENTMGDELADVKTESKFIKRRIVIASPYTGTNFNRNNNFYKSNKIGNRRNQMTFFFPINKNRVRNRYPMTRLKAKSKHYMRYPLLKRKRKIRPIYPVHNSIRF